MMSNAENQQAANNAPDQQQELKQLLKDNDFLQDIAQELGIDNIDSIIGGGAASDQAKKDEEDKKKKEEDKK